MSLLQITQALSHTAKDQGLWLWLLNEINVVAQLEPLCLLFFAGCFSIPFSLERSHLCDKAYALYAESPIHSNVSNPVAESGKNPF